MDNQEYLKVSKEIRNYKMARINVVAILAFTLISFIMYFVSESYFLFSIFTSVLFIALGKEYQKVPATGAMVACIIVAILILAVFVAFWLLSKKHRWAMIVLLVLFAGDCLAIIVSILIKFNAQAILDIAFHAWMMYYFILGVKAAANLQKHFPQGVTLTQEQLNEAYRMENGIDPVTGQPVFGPDGQPIAPQNVPQNGGVAASVEEAQPCVPATPVGYDPMTGEPIYEDRTVKENETKENVSAKPDSPVLREEDDKRVPAVETVYKGMKVSVKIAPFSNKARIVVDGKVYAEQKLKLFSGSSFSAVVNGTEFGFEYLLHGTAGEYILYADGNIIAHRY